MERFRSRWAWAVAAVLGVVVGCSSSDEAGGSSGGVTGDGGVTLADGSSSASDAGPGILGGQDAGGTPVVGSLLPNGGFETPGEMCGPGWTAQNGSGIKVSLAHGGALACRVCNGAETSGSFATVASIASPKAGTWKVHAFLRVEPEAGYPLPERGELAMTSYRGDGSSNGNGHTRPSLTSTWTAVDLTFDVPADAAKVDVSAGGLGDPGACVEVDDVSVEAP